jgi:undecaprenyl-diphosphatase
MLEMLNLLDAKLFIIINSHHNYLFDNFFIIISQLGNGWIAVPLVAAIIIAVTPRTYLARALLYAALAGTLAGVVNTQIKRAVHRPRPVVYFEKQSAAHEMGGENLPPVHVVGKALRRHSFPSGHAATAFAAATILALLYGGWFFTGFLPALLVAYSRVYIGAHFPLDVCGGAILGSSIALLTLLLFRQQLLPLRRGHAQQ